MMSPGCCLVTLHQFFLLCIQFQHISKCSIRSGSLSMRRCRRRIRHKWRYVETWLFSQHQTKHSSSSFEYATSNCCKAGINPFSSSTGSGTVPKDPPCGNRVTFVSIVQCGGNSSPRALERAVSHGYDAACGRTFYKGLCSWAGQTVLHSW